MDYPIFKRILFWSSFVFQAYAVLGAVGTLSAFLIYYDATPEILSYILFPLSILLWHPEACVVTFVISIISLFTILIIHNKEKKPLIIITLIINTLNTLLYGSVSLFLIG